MTGHVFISYSHAADGSYVDDLARYLTDAGIKVWFDREIIHGERVIREKIDSCTALIVVMTPSAEDSDWVGREINRAELKGKPVLPLLLKGEPFFRLSTLQFEDVTGSRMPSSAFLTRLGGDRPDRTEPAKVVAPQRLAPRHRQISVIPEAGSVIAFSPDGTVLACGSKTVRMWNIADPARPVPVTAPAEQTSQLRSMAFSPDGTILACGGNGRAARLWNLNQLAHPIATGGQPTVRLWSMTDPAHPVSIATLAGHSSLTSLAFSPDGTLLAATAGKKVRLWNITDPLRPAESGAITQAGLFKESWAVAFSKDGAILATGGWDKLVRLWNVADSANPEQFATLEGHTKSVVSLSFSPNGAILASGSVDDTVRLWAV